MSLFRISPQVLGSLSICLAAVLAAMYGIALFAPAIGLAYSDGAVLLEAVTHRFGANPPLFPLLLTLPALISHQAWWLKLTPLVCTILWLVLTRRLLVKMGSSPESAWVLVAMTALSPTVLYLATGLFPETLFGLLVTGCLLALLAERPGIAGLCAGLATATLTCGATLIAACLLTLAAHRRFRSAVVFTGTAMTFAAPWLGWSLAHGGVAASRLHLNELATLLGSNAMLLAASPFTLLTGYPSLYPGLLTAVALLIVLIRRRLFVPDLFIGFYCLFLLFRTEPPLFAFAPVVPLFLWMLWRVARVGRFAGITKAAAVLMAVSALWFGVARIVPVVTVGAVASDKAPPNNWREMEKLFAFIRANTAPDAVLLADLDPVFYLNTGRRSIRGFEPDSYRSYYAPPGSLVTPDQLRTAVLRDHVSYVVLTPDRELAESGSFHKAVAALERGGVLEPVSVPGMTADYRVLRVTHGFASVRQTPSGQ